MRPFERKPRLPKDAIVSAYKDLVQMRGGKVVGQHIFQRVSGITAYYWQGYYWRRWSEFQTYCGFPPNRQNTRIPDEVLLRKYAEAALKLGRLPVETDIRMLRNGDRSIPNSTAFRHLGMHDGLMAKLAAYCQGKPEFAPVAAMVEQDHVRFMSRYRESGRSRGFVYLARLGEHGDGLYAIGRLGRTPGDTRCLKPSPPVLKDRPPILGRRKVQRLATEMSGLPNTVHLIDTDDPEGIADYWRRRFQARCFKENCYCLYPEDVAAFKRRHYQ